MDNSPLENLARTGKLKKEPATQEELMGLIRSGLARLNDAKNPSLSIESRFDLAYNAAHALSLAALRRCGFRSDNRYLVFQFLPHTLGLGAAEWRVLDQAHNKRNLAEYQGSLEVNVGLVEAVIRVTQIVADRVKSLEPAEPKEEKSMQSTHFNADMNQLIKKLAQGKGDSMPAKTRKPKGPTGPGRQ